MEGTEQAAVEQARAGDREAFRMLVERHSRTVFRLAYRMTGHEQDAEDIVQETFLRAYRQLHQFDERASFGTWLHRIAANCAMDLLRGRKRRQEQPQVEELFPIASPDPTPDRLALSSEVQRRVAAALDELSAAERTAFVMRHFEGVRIEEIGQALGVQPGAARHSVFRAVQKLRRALEPLVASVK